MHKISGSICFCFPYTNDAKIRKFQWMSHKTHCKHFDMQPMYTSEWSANLTTNSGKHTPKNNGGGDGGNSKATVTARAIAAAAATKPNANNRFQWMDPIHVTYTLYTCTHTRTYARTHAHILAGMLSFVIVYSLMLLFSFERTTKICEVHRYWWRERKRESEHAPYELRANVLTRNSCSLPHSCITAQHNTEHLVLGLGVLGYPKECSSTHSNYNEFKECASVCVCS